MSFCSYEEAWGAPYETGSSEPHNEHKIKSKEAEIVQKQVVKNTHVQNSDNDIEGFEESTVAPLRGTLLGGVIPEKQWEVNHPEEIDCDNSFEARFDAKIDKLLNNLDKFAKSLRRPLVSQNSEHTSWTDVLIFIALGIAAIFLLDMFFKFGKWIVETKSKIPQYSAPQQFNQQMNYQPQQYYRPPPPVPSYFPDNLSSIPRPSM
jgi:hypothetical protein